MRRAPESRAYNLPPPGPGVPRKVTMAKAEPKKKPATAASGAPGTASAKRPAAKTPAKAAAKKASPATKPTKAAKAAPAKPAAGPLKKARATAKASAAPAKAAKATPARSTPAKAPTKPAAAKNAAPATAAAPATKPARPAPARRKPTTVICPLSGFEVRPDQPNLSERTIERLRSKLLEERARHVQQADELQAEAEALAVEREGGDTQFDEESGEGDTLNVERERDLLLSASARQIVDEIDRALERMKAGTYGVCVPAGRRIPLERLEALPYAEYCVDCKARAERRR
jgi:RNA polymerase-binding transcription factor DksA